MTNLEKRNAALKLLEASGISKGFYAPLTHRFYWWIGLDVIPPHFSKFWINALLVGIPFGVLWGAFKYFTQWSMVRMSLWDATVVTLAGVAAIGLVMAFFYAYDRKKRKLPTWEEIQ